VLDTAAASEKVGKLQNFGENLLVDLDYDLYDRWNAVSLQVLDLIFGQPSDPYMSFKFPGGGEAANSREGRVKNSITQKLKVLDFVQQDMESKELKPKFGWTNSSKEIDEALAGLESS